MMKKYSTPTYEVVQIRKKDVIATSTVTSVYNEVGFVYGGGWNGYARAVDRFFDDYDIYLGY